MKLTNTIKFKLTVLYLTILAVLLLILGSSIYFGLSHMLLQNLDRALRDRSTQLSQFPDIISVVASGTFEEETQEQLSFFFYSGSQLMRVSHRGFNVPVSVEAIQKAIKGKCLSVNLKNPQGKRMRLLITPFKPDRTSIRPERIQPQRNLQPGDQERPQQGYGREPRQGDPPQGGGREPRQGDPQQGYGREPRQGDPQQGGGREPRQGDPPQGGGREPRQGDPQQGGGREPRQGDPQQGGGREPRQGDPQQGQGREYDGPGRPPGPGSTSIELDTQSAVLVVARPLKDIDDTLAQLLKILMAACPLTLILSGCGGVYLAQRAFTPVEQITRTAREIQAQDLTRRIEVHSTDELGILASTINEMLERLDRAFARQQQFTSDASHELRAPLAVIEAESTLALQKHRSPEEYVKSLEIIAQEADHMSALINQLLTLARADAGKEQVRFEKIDLRKFMEEICVDAEILCREKELALNLSLEEKISVQGDGRSLRRLMHNLLSNAINYTARGGTITIELSKEETQALLKVSDNGIGISPSDLPHIFERFYRVDKARTRDEGGSGLGLSLCRHIVDIHGGRIDVESLQGKGSTFLVRLPLDNGQ